MHIPPQVTLVIFIVLVLLFVAATILISRAFYLRGIQKGWAMKEQSLQGAPQDNTTQRTSSNVFMRPIRAIWEPSVKK